jgi:hypothetical protein
VSARHVRAFADVRAAWRAVLAGPHPVADAKWLCWLLWWRVTLGVAKRTISLPVLVKLVRSTAGSSVDHEQADMHRRMMRQWFADQSLVLPGNCLERSLLVYATWAPSSASTELVVGFRKAGRDTQGHTWVNSDGHVLLEASSDVAGFEPAFVFDAGGTRTTAGAAA